MSKWGRLGILMCLLFTTQVWASIGKVSLLKGEASASRNNQAVTLSNGIALEEHDIITTHANSQVQLTFEDKTVITLGSESILDIKEYLNDAQEPKAKFKFSQGTFKSITGHIGKKAPDNFNLETKTSTIGIRGTTVIGAIGQGDTADTIGCLSGRIMVMNALGSVLLTPGFLTTVSSFAPPPPPTTISPQQMQHFFGGVLSGLPSTLGDQQGALGGLNASTLMGTPLVALNAQDTNLQIHTTTNLTTQINNTIDPVDSFYLTFNPTLQSASSNDGIIALTGYATSHYKQDGTTITSAEDAFSLAINSSNDSLLNTEVAFSTILLDRTNPYALVLTKASDASTMTYKEINKISIKDFDDYQGWIKTENTYTNDYVSWGYWAIKANDDTKLLETTNYWVAGVNSDAANNYVQTLMTGNGASYTYNGNVLGSVSNGTNSYAIDPTTNNAVLLKFNFGSGYGSIDSNSYIKFQTTQATPQSWQINPVGMFEGGSFYLQNEATVAINNVTDNGSMSTIKGTFYGTTAQAVGGTFSASSGSNTATGVYKAVR